MSSRRRPPRRFRAAARSCPAGNEEVAVEGRPHERSQVVSVPSMIDPAELSTEVLEALLDACGRELHRRQQTPTGLVLIEVHPS
ncbi:hypothetical protein Ae356Ps1_0571 [Pseudonocardia sp. Ae356_Ps1]|nr:hypothetical protein Ae356Ps1_0571 [Pseudonocardia sp. Ae356_Ps1]